MIEIILFGLTSFGVGLSGAIVPGPMLTVTISDSVKKGPIVGPQVVLGHIMTEIMMMIVILAGLGWIIGSKTAALIIGIGGGAVLIYMGYNISVSSNKLYNTSNSTNTSEKSGIQHGSIFNGIITSLSNPYFFIWWASVGCAFMYKGLELAGIVGLLGFIIGHWSADLSWYSMISFFSSHGSKIMNDRTYKIMMKACGIFLVILGIYFVISVLNII